MSGPRRDPVGTGLGPRAYARTRVALVGYTRVSTSTQADNGISLEEQERAIRRYAEAHDAVLVAVETDAGLSGRTTRRAGLQRILARLKAKEADGVVVARLDRLSRSLRDAADLFARARGEGWQIHSLAERLDTASPSGTFVAHVLAAMAQWEREMAGERTRAALGELRRQGRRISGRPPFGHAFDGDRVVEVPAELEVLRKLQRLQARGLGAKAIASRMNAAAAFNPRTGRPWHHGVVRDVLARAARG
ncbi:MAG: recombinase family protein [Planctomycetes bacterium]|nr:recombinase family protein [Planctomycetota bacterium]